MSTLTYPQLREQLCQTGREMARAGYVAAHDGNLSVRTPEGGVLITPSGVSKGELTPECLLELSPVGDCLTPGGVPSSETPMHLEVYRRCPDLGAVVHTHSPYALAMASQGEDLTAPITADAVLLLGNVPALPYLPLGSQALADGVGEASHTANAVLLACHGAVTWGRDLREAWWLTQALEQYCRQLFLQSLLPRPGAVIPREEADALIARRRAGGVKRGGDHMPPGL